METKGIVHRLVVGQQNIDKMKAEIRTIVPMMVKLSGLRKSEKRARLEFDSDEFHWDIRGSLTDRDLFIRCYGEEKNLFIAPHKEGSTGKRQLLLSCSIGSADQLLADPDLEHIEAVYDALDVFVAGMIGAFPELENKLHPIFLAKMKF